jgi:hypothetical protein
MPRGVARRARSEARGIVREVKVAGSETKLAKPFTRERPFLRIRPAGWIGGEAGDGPRAACGFGASSAVGRGRAGDGRDVATIGYRGAHVGRRAADIGARGTEIGRRGAVVCHHVAIDCHHGAVICRSVAVICHRVAVVCHRVAIDCEKGQFTAKKGSRLPKRAVYLWGAGAAAGAVAAGGDCGAGSFRDARPIAYSVPPTSTTTPVMIHVMTSGDGPFDVFVPGCVCARRGSRAASCGGGDACVCAYGFDRSCGNGA